METTDTLYIRNMVCDRCRMVVRELFAELGIEPLSVELGVVRTAVAVEDEQRKRLDARLRELGFELIDEPRQQIVERVKAEIIRLVHRDNGALRVNLSDRLTEATHHEYSQISKLFSETTGTTVEKYFIAQKIERVKELLTYGELSLGEIADLMNYSSAAHLSAQFKSLTGMTPTRFREQAAGHRKPLDKV
ncbi:helix-turn-helix domain-containing protein [Alistipes timonensis]|uniref:Helix-turn-helix domain-containing protein n=1 Tax=Alistipes timonensis JC136 TaxID=1033731 RepID=A0A1H3Y8G3_9BACT|nr:helix-turn-helix transcriptional regulator [Alistipes timonensis]MCR2029864.1 helix-turn-helix transcriptional regulator [Alistipes timonensis]SEA07214.1 Helix-turn-helix domain-containing protein [Alistipes timonensis JC136]